MNPARFRKHILDWYDHNRRDLPWRAGPEEQPDPYCVWLSEIMLQQTTVTAVKPYFETFLARWPAVHDLAAASQDEVMQAWAGLGYYARARNLHKCAQIIAMEHNGVFPDTQEGLKALPGIGDYTSAAIMTIAFNKPAVVVDGNIERIMARYHAVEKPLPAAKRDLKAYAAPFFEGFTARPGDFAQALMDLGSRVCTVKNPSCLICPVKPGCRAQATGMPAAYPKRAQKKPKPQRCGYVYWLTNDHDQVLLHRRPEEGLLGGTLALPTSAWTDQPAKPAHIETGSDLSFRERSETVTHSFTHFDLVLYPCSAPVKSHGFDEQYFWSERRQIDPDAFPSVFKKAVLLFSR